MDHANKKKPSGSRDLPKTGRSLGWVITLSVACGVVIGSAGTRYFAKPVAAPKQSAVPAPGGTPLSQTVTMPPQQQQFTPAPQPPGEVPPGKVWSVEHGHWHDAPVAMTTPVAAPAAMAPPPPTPLPPPAPVEK